MGGAAVLGRQDEIGSLEPGKLADLALWRLDTLAHVDIADPVAALVLGSPPPLELLLVDGAPVVEQDRLVTVDEQDVAARGRCAPAPGSWRGRADDARPATHHRRPPPDGGGGLGDSPLRPDGTLKVTGEFAYSSDLWMDGMLWGVTLRSPHPFARIVAIDTTEALATAGGARGADRGGRARAATSTASSCPTSRCWPHDVVRYQGEAVALVAADHPETARQAAKRIRVDYQVWEPVTDAAGRARPSRAGTGCTTRTRTPSS